MPETLKQTGIVNRLANSSTADIARRVLPERFKKKLVEVVRGRPQYPLAEPITVTVGGVDAMFWIKNPSDRYRIYENFEGDYGKKIIEVVASTTNPQFADIGSAQGYYSILAAKAGAEVVAFDPDPVSLKSLIDNLTINPDVAPKIHSLNFALSHQEGELPFHIDRSGSCAPSLFRTVRDLNEIIQVPVTTMDIMIASEQINPPEIVKIDVEGAERLVIEGMKDTLTSERKPKDIFVELHAKFLPLFGSSPEEVQKQITTYGYNLVNSWERRSELLCHYSLQ